MSLVVGFDLDLTLVDSAEGITASYVEAARRVGVDIDPNELLPLIGLPLPETMARFVPAESVSLAVHTYRELFPTLSLPTSKLLPGAQDAVDAVHRRGGQVVVISAKIEPQVRDVLHHVGLVVDDVVGERSAETKGDVLREYGAVGHVGDHPGDMIGARSAGVYAVGITTGAHDALALREAGADVVFTDLLDFPYWFDDFLASREASEDRR